VILADLEVGEFSLFETLLKKARLHIFYVLLFTFSKTAAALYVNRK
jgi:hypothetical protein